MAGRYFAAAVAAGRKPKCLACSHLFVAAKDCAAFMIVSSKHGTKAGQIPICKNCFVLRHATLPIFVDEAMQQQLGVAGFSFDDADSLAGDQR